MVHFTQPPVNNSLMIFINGPPASSLSALEASGSFSRMTRASLLIISAPFSMRDRAEFRSNLGLDRYKPLGPFLLRVALQN